MRSGKIHLEATDGVGSLSASGVTGLAAFGLIAAYVAGHLFFRQDPSGPDLVSWRLTEGRNTPPDTSAKYPYPFLKQLLADRGAYYLSERIPWDSTDDLVKCTKHFINSLKIRLGFSFPASMTAIARNEAHIRLSSSMWYVAGALKWPAIAGAVLGVVANLLNGMNPPSDLRLVIWPILVLVTLGPVRHAIERAYHYQRRREIFFILETAFWANGEVKGQDFFTGWSTAPAEGSQGLTIEPARVQPPPNTAPTAL